MFSDTRNRGILGHFLHVPTLVGTTAQEGDIFAVGAQLLTIGLAVPGVTEQLSDIVTKVRCMYLLSKDHTLTFPSGAIHLSREFCCV